MEQQERSIIIKDSLQELNTEAYKNHLAHALCTGGSCHLLYNGEELQIKQGDLMIVRKGKLIEKIIPDSDFRVTTIYVSSKFIEQSTPRSNYGMKGSMALFLNPIMHLTPTMYDQCLRNFEDIHIRLAQTGHHFYRDMMINMVQSLILDFFDFHVSLYQENNVSTQYAQLMNRFISLLENGEYRMHREVSWYADQLCVTSKYLSEVSKSVSGHAANFWINRYTTLDISRLLRDKVLSFSNISDLFGFSSPAYFSRYVLHYLGVNPTEYRG